jgi:hypothetical protein
MQVGKHLEGGVLRKDMFKIVYVAPMKALAQEVTCACLAPVIVLIIILISFLRYKLVDSAKRLYSPENVDSQESNKG